MYFLLISVLICLNEVGFIFIPFRIIIILLEKGRECQDFYSAFWVFNVGIYLISSSFPNLRIVIGGLKSSGSILSLIENNKKTRMMRLDDPQSKKIHRITEDLRFEKVFFKYSSKTTLAFDEISLCFEVGKTTALVGESG